MRIILFAIAMLFAKVGFAADAEWSADLTTKEGLMAIDGAKNLRWRTTHTSFVRQHRDVIELLSMYNKANPASEAQLSMSYTRTEYSYTPVRVTKSYSDERIGVFRKSLKEMVEKIFFSGEIVVVPNNLGQLVDSVNGNQNLFKHVLFLWPLSLPEGKTRIFQKDLLLKKIDSLTNDVLNVMYMDTWKTALVPQAEKGAKDNHRAIGWINWVKTNFYEKSAVPAFRLDVVIEPETDKRRLVLETTPPTVATVRGEWGRDCSRWSAWLYAMSKDVRVYSFWTDDLPTPRGYAFVIEVPLHGKIIPYVLTINGDAVTFAETRALLSAIASEYATEEIMVPELKKQMNFSVVNTDPIREAMRYADGTPMRIQLPSDWQRITEFLASVGTGQYINAYANETIANVRLVNLVKDPEQQKLILARGAVTRDSYPQAKIEKMDDKSVSLPSGTRDVRQPQFGAEFELNPNARPIFVRADDLIGVRQAFQRAIRFGQNVVIEDIDRGQNANLPALYEIMAHWDAHPGGAEPIAGGGHIHFNAADFVAHPADVFGPPAGYQAYDGERFARGGAIEFRAHDLIHPQDLVHAREFEQALLNRIQNFHLMDAVTRDTFTDEQWEKLHESVKKRIIEESKSPEDRRQSRRAERAQFFASLDAMVEPAVVNESMQLSRMEFLVRYIASSLEQPFSPNGAENELSTVNRQTILRLWNDGEPKVISSKDFAPVPVRRLSPPSLPPAPPSCNGRLAPR